MIIWVGFGRQSLEGLTRSQAFTRAWEAVFRLRAEGFEPVQFEEVLGFYKVSFEFRGRST